MLRWFARPPALLLAVAALLSVAWTFSTAPFQGPDEPAHFNYIQYLAETGSRPAVLEGDHPDSSQVFSALYFLNLDQLAGVADARPAWSPLEERRFDAELRAAGERAEEDGSGPNPLAKNPPLFYAYQVVPYAVGSAGSFWDRLVVMRLANGLLFLLTVAFTWLTAAELFARLWPRVVATGCVALLPQLASLSGTMNADNMLIAVWTAFAFVAVRLARRGPSTGRVLALCALAAASLLTHGRGTAIALPLVVTLAVVLFRARPPVAQAARWLAPGLGVLVAAFAVYRFLLAPETGAYGGEVVLSPSGGMSVTGFLNATWQFYLPKLPFMEVRAGPAYGYREVFIESFFGRFATLEVGFTEGTYTLIQWACAFGLVALVAAVARRWDTVLRRWPEVTVLAVIAVAMVGLLHLASYRSLVGSGDPLITGRYLLPLVVVFGVTVAFAIDSLGARASAIAGSLVLAGLLALNLAGLGLTLARFYG